MFHEFERHQLDRIERKLDALLGAAGLTIRMEKQMAKTLDEILQQEQDTLDRVNKDADLDNSILTVLQADAQKITDLKAQLDAAGTDPQKLAALGDLMDQVAAAQVSAAQRKTDAITANTPAA